MPETQDLMCAGCEELFNRRHGDYVHRVFFCYECIWKTEIHRVRALEQDKQADRKQVLELNAEVLKLRDFGMKLITAVEATKFISMQNNKSELACALRVLREYLCQR